MKAFVRHVNKSGSTDHGDSAFSLEETLMKTRLALVSCSDGERVEIDVIEREHKES